MSRSRYEADISVSVVSFISSSMVTINIISRIFRYEKQALESQLYVVYLVLVFVLMVGDSQKDILRQPEIWG